MADKEEQKDPQVVSDNEQCVLDNLARWLTADADDIWHTTGLSPSSKRAFPT
jgi:hypothetical protein